MKAGQIIFIIILAVVAYLAYKSYSKIIYNIRLGKANRIVDRPKDRWRNVILIALGQKKMFKKVVPAFLHLFIYLAFLLTQVELIEILLDGILGKHRILAPVLGGFYTLVIATVEILSVLALVATSAFLIRRLILKIPRFFQSEMIGWPSKDAIIILGLEALLLFAIFTMNGTDVLLQGIMPEKYPDTGTLPVSQFLGPWLFGGMETSTLMFLERMAWWLHVLAVFGFLLYLPISKHLHILLAFPNTYFAKLTPKGEMDNMPDVMSEVKSMLGLTTDDVAVGDGAMDELPEFGAKDVMDLPWNQLLAAYTCTECGRCTSQCPANLTGKKLSPRKIMMDVRDRAEEVGEQMRKRPADSEEVFDDGRSLFDYISPEEIHACTTCNACVEACPIMINPLDIILQLRRYEILTLSQGPSDWVPMFNSLENTGAVWQLPEERDAWIRQ
ncbi:(Fe-S)-binding protein [Membranihabitans marinus]|uniref:(Fe-S)-binding protein n=1 Tax=Membranihabitans marinus TaxID=1227546 RepID=UPI001F2163CE|nr:(Fe-S)-binding protein [Membranihabitans marinus]